MKVLLIAPPDNNLIEPYASLPEKPTPLIWGFPLGLGYLASYLQKFGHEPVILDCLRYHYNLETVKEKIKEIGPDLVGITIMTPWAKAGVAVAKLIKKIDKNLPVVAGGSHAAFDYENLLKKYHFDYVITGEGEITLLELANFLSDKKKNTRNRILGLAFKKAGQIFTNPPRPLIENLDELPFPARELTNFDDYIVDGLLPKAVEIVGSRGCSHRCAFCSSSHFWQRWRARSPENIIKEMRFLLKNYPQIKSFLFYDDNFTFSQPRVEKLCRLLIKEELQQYSWSCLARADQVNEKMLKLMKKAGCTKVSYGLESGSPRILKNINKYLDLSVAEEAIKTTKRVGLEALVFFMIGNPGENEATINQSIKLAKKLKPTSVIWGITQILPGTRLAELQPIDDFIDYVYQPELKNPYLFTSAFVPAYENIGLNREKLKKIHQKLYRYFTLYPLLTDPLSRIRHFFYSPRASLAFLFNLFKD
jgi:anaerobic magnesium-protoporphyrin IX monomethyl ester cyclase